MDTCSKGLLCKYILIYFTYLLFLLDIMYVCILCVYVRMHVCVCVHVYTGCPRRNVPDFGRVFLMLKYTDITQKTYVQSGTVTEIMAREKCGLLAGPRTVPVGLQCYACRP